MNIIKTFSKSKNKKLIALLSCTALLTNIFASTANALVMNSSSLIKDTYFKDKDKGFMYYTSEINDQNGEVVYCMNSDKDFPTNLDYTSSKVLDDTALTILENGYPNASITGDDKIDRIITQTAIWAYVDSDNVNINNLIGINKVNYVETENQELTNALKEFYNKCISDTIDRNVTAKFKDTNLVLTQEGDVFKTNQVELNIFGSNIKINKNAKLVLDSNDIKAEEISIIDKDGNKLPSGEIPINKPFNVEISIETANKISKMDKFEINAELPFTIKKAIAYESPDELIQDIVKIEWKEQTVNTSNKLNITGDYKGEIKIIKQDSSSKELLDGAVFNIKDHQGNIIETTKPTVNGIVLSSELPLGEYKLEEITAPENYILSKNEVTVNLNSTNIVEVVVKNDKAKGSVELTKIDKDNKTALEGAVFELYKEGKTDLIGEFTTDKNGVIKVDNLDVGKYIFKETKSPEGYELEVNNLYEFDIENNKETKIVIENMLAQGELFFTKTDLVTGEVVEGAKIEITGIEEKNKNIKVEFISSKEGNKIQLPLGKYQIKETIAPEGYVISEEVGEFEIISKTDVIKVELKNRPMLFHVEISKLDSKDKNKALAGAEFAIYDKDGKELGKGTTNKNGKLRFENLLFGEYTVKEIKAPTGYQLNSESLSIKSPEKDGDTIIIEVLNTPTKLVQTGGEISTLLIVGVGIALVIGGAIYIVKSKDTKKDKIDKSNKK